MFKRLDRLQENTSRAELLREIVKQAKGLVKDEDLRTLVKHPMFWEDNYVIVTTKNMNTFEKYKQNDTSEPYHMLSPVLGDLEDKDEFHCVFSQSPKSKIIAMYIPLNYDKKLKIAEGFSGHPTNTMSKFYLYEYVKSEYPNLINKVNFIREFDNPISFSEACRVENKNNPNKASIIEEHVLAVMEIKLGMVIEKNPSSFRIKEETSEEDDALIYKRAEVDFDISRSYAFIKVRKTRITNKNDKYSCNEEVIVNYYQPNLSTFGLDQEIVDIMSEYVLRV